MDRKKYIVEASDDVKKVIALGVTHGGAIWTDTTDIENLEELNSDYINEHFGDLQDEAYERGLDDAWEAAKKIIHMPEGDLLNIFTECYSAVCTALQVLLKYDAAEAIEKLKAYEEKQKAEDDIKVGDEVISNFTKTKGILLEPETQHLLARVIVPNDRWSTFNIRHANLTKTGRHFNIEKLLEEMKK